MSDTVARLRLTATGGDLVAEVGASKRAIQEVGSTADAAGKRADLSFRSAAGGAEYLARQISQAKAAALSFVGLAGAREMADDVIAASTAVSGWRQALAASKGSNEAAAVELRYVRTEVNDLGLDLRGTASDYVKLTAASRGTSLEGQKTRDIFHSVAEASRVLHLSADSTSGALNAIQQMISKGNVQSEELRGQLGERLPGAFQIAAKAMGVTTQELDKMLEKGEVAATTLIPKLAAELHRLYGDQAAEAANGPAAQLARVKNAVFELEAAIGDAGFMQQLANGAVSLSDALTRLTHSGQLDTLVTGIELIGVAAVTAFGGRGLAAMGVWGTELMKLRGEAVAAAQIHQEMAMGALASARAEEVSTAATVAATQAKLREAQANLEAVAAVRADAAAHLESANAQRLAAEAAGAQSFAIRAVTEAQVARSVSLAELAALGQNQVRMEAELTAALTAEAAAQVRAAEAAAVAGAAQIRAAEATAVATAAASASTAATGLLARAGSGLLAILGGWPGVALAAGAGLIYLSMQENAAEKEASKLEETLARLNDTNAEVSEKSIAAADALVREGEAAIKGAQQQLAAMVAMGDAMSGASDAGGMARGRLADDIIRLKGVAGELEKKAEELRQRWAALNTTVAENPAWTDAEGNIKSLISAIGAKDQQMQKLAGTYKEGHAAELQWQIDQTKAALATKFSGEALKALNKEIDDGSKAYLDHARAADAMIAKKKALAGADERQRALEEQQRRSWAASANALERLEQINEQYAASLNGPVQAAARQNIAAQRELDRVWDVLAKDGPPVAEVMDQITKAVHNQSAAYELNAKRATERAEAVLRARQDLDRELENELRLAGMIGTAREAEERSIKAQEIALREYLAALGTEHEMTEQDRAAREASIKTRLDEIASVQKLTRVTEDYVNVAKRSADEATDVFKGMLDGSIQSFDDFGKALTRSGRTYLDGLVDMFQKTVLTPNGGGMGQFATNLNKGSMYGAGGTGGTVGGWGSAIGSAYGGWQNAKNGGSAWSTIGSFTAAGAQIGGVYGAIIGAVVGILVALFVKHKPPDVRIGGLQGNVRDPENTFATALGSVRIGTRATDQTPIREAVQKFDQAIHDMIGTVDGGEVQLRRITSALDTWAVDLKGKENTVENLLGSRFDRILSTFDADVQAFVNGADKLEDRVQRLGDAFKAQSVFADLGLDVTFAQFLTFVDQAQAIGESTGQTMQRVLGSTKLFGDVLEFMDISIDKSGDAFVRFATKIADAAGGLETAQKLWDGFLNRFYSTEEIGQKAIEAARAAALDQLGDIGMQALPSMPDFRAQFEAALPNLSAEEIVEWLQAGNALADLNDAINNLGDGAEDAAAALEKQATAVQAYADFIAGVSDQISDMDRSDFQRSLHEVNVRFRENTQRANELARAAGLLGARQEDLTRIQLLAARQAARAAAELKAAAIDNVTALFGDVSDAANEAHTSITNVANGFQTLAAAASNFHDSMLLDPTLSPLNAQQQLDEAIRQLRATGDESTGRRALEIARGLRASGADYRRDFDLITSLVRPAGPGNVGTPYGGRNDSSAAADAAMSPAERMSMAKELAQQLADLAGFEGVDFSTAAGELDLNLDDLGKELHLSSKALETYLKSLQGGDYDPTSTVDAGSQAIVDALYEIFAGGPHTKPVAVPHHDGDVDVRGGSTKPIQVGKGEITGDGTTVETAPTGGGRFGDGNRPAPTRPIDTEISTHIKGVIDEVVLLRKEVAALRKERSSDHTEQLEIAGDIADNTERGARASTEIGEQLGRERSTR